MPSKEELIKKFETKSNIELVELYNHRGEYTTDAVEAMEIVFKDRGGITVLIEEYTKQKEKETEKIKLRRAIDQMLKTHASEHEILSSVKSDLLSQTEIEELLDKGKITKEEEKKDLHVNERTLLMGGLGILTGGTLSGFILAVQIIYTGKILYLLVALSAVIPYLTIRAFTGQSQKNIAVVIMTVIAFLYAIALCTIICSVIGIKLL